MNEICQLAQGISSLRYFAFSLSGLLAFIGLAGAYIYLEPIKMIIHRTIALINSIFGLIGAGILGFLIFANKFLC